ncbi:MAG: sugar ABC transporter substrate-binding protein, partial [Chloroflexi bacterium]|nr:sugar ABC transporter substrate-binding protein [Chloroflexota bacterium]
MRARWLSCLSVVLLAFGLLLTARANVGRAAGSHIKGCTAHGTISFMFWGDRGEQTEQHADVKLAERSCPGLHVVEIWDQGKYDTDLAASIAAGNGPDVFQLDPEKYLPYYVSRGALADLDPYVQHDRLNLRTIYWPSCLSEARYNGHVWGLPRDCSSQGVLFYNKDMFDARHVPYPTDRWTYADFLAAAQKLTGDYSLPSDPTSRLRFGYAWNNDEWRLNQYLWDWGGDWLSKDQTRCTLTDGPAQQALAWWRDLRYKYHGAPTAQQMQFSEDFSRGFKDQNYAMTFAGAWALNYILTPSPYTGNPPARFRWGAAITPLGPASRQALMGTALEVINRRSKNKNAAWWLTRFLTEGKGGALEGSFG